MSLIKQIFSLFKEHVKEHDYEWKEEESGCIRPTIYKCKHCDKRVDMTGKGLLKWLPKHERYGCPIDQPKLRR